MAFGYPKHRKQEYKPGPWASEAWDEVRKMLRGDDLRYQIGRTAARGYGAAQTAGYRQAVGRFADDPALLSSVIANLSQATGRGVAEAGERGVMAQAGQRSTAAGRMMSMAEMRMQIDEVMKRLNLQQKQRQEDYWQDLIGGLLSAGGQIGGAFIGRPPGLGKVARG